MFREMLSDFKAFLLRGNLIELAVAIVIGVAFAQLVNSLVSDLLTPVIAAVFGEPALGTMTFEIRDAIFFYGNFLNEVITFVAIAAAVYFLVVLPVNRVTERMRRGDSETAPEMKSCPECLSLIPTQARRCAFCTSQVA